MRWWRVFATDRGSSILRRIPAPGVTPPGIPNSNPYFVESGFVVEAFWAVQIGTPNAHFVKGHFHPTDLSSGFEGQHWGGLGELHGIFIRAEDGRPFSVRSLKYRVTMNRELRRHQSIEIFTLTIWAASDAEALEIELRRYDGQGWRAMFFASGFEHSLTSHAGSAWARGPWEAVQRAGLDALLKIDGGADVAGCDWTETDDAPR